VIRFLQTVLAAIFVLALTGCYGVEGVLRIGEDDGAGASVSINLFQGVEKALFEGDDERGRAYISGRYGGEWDKGPYEDPIYSIMFLTQQLETPASFSDTFGNSIRVTRSTAEDLPDGRPEYWVVMKLELPEPTEDTEFLGVALAVEYPEAWRLRVVADGGALITDSGPGRSNVNINQPGEYQTTLVLFPPWEPPPIGSAPNPAAPEPTPEPTPEPELAGEDPVQAAPEAERPTGPLDISDLDAEAVQPGSVEVEEINLEGVQAESVTEITPEGGVVEAEGSRYPARSLSGVIPAGATVEVLTIGDTYLFVQQVDEEAGGLGLWVLAAALVFGAVGAGVLITLVLRSRKESSSPPDQ